MKDKILELIKSHPKSYQWEIKRHKELWEWVIENTKIKTSVTNSTAEFIYSAVTGETNRCENGELKKFVRFSVGYSGCGPAAKCECVRKSIAEKVSSTKQQLPDEVVKASNAKREETLMAKYGTQFNSQRAEIKDRLFKPRVSLEKLANRTWVTNEFVTEGKTIIEIARELKVTRAEVVRACQKFNLLPNTVQKVSFLQHPDAEPPTTTE